MKAIPSYGKILTLGSAFTENAIVGNISIQEKVDGSLFAFGVNEDGEVVMRSKGAILTEDNHAQMFDEAVAFVLSKEEYLKKMLPTDSYFYCEYLQKPKHNTLKYRQIPKNHLVLFDHVQKGKYVDREVLVNWAWGLEIDVIPELWTGNLSEYVLSKPKGMSLPLDFIKRLIETTTSYLGEEIIEGVVIKNYSQTILLGGNLYPLFTKYVRESFKERHNADWKVRQPKDNLQSWFEGFKSEARWQKSIIHAREKGLLQQAPQDIGPLMKMIQQDIQDEEEANIKNYLYKAFIQDILRKAVHGFPVWYKEQLLQNVS
jgi:hypothetical protein